MLWLLLACDGNGDLSKRDTSVAQDDDDDDDTDSDDCSWFVDDDGDGDGDPDEPRLTCEPTTDLVATGTDCDDDDPLVFDGADEQCNGSDDDCDGLVPDDEIDMDGDGFSVCQGDPDDDDASVDPDYEHVIGAATTAVAVDGAFRGMEFEASNIGRLLRFGYTLDLPAACEVSYYVFHRETDSSDPGVAWSAATTQGPGMGFYDSPDLQFDYTIGEFYMLGVGVNCAATFYGDTGFAGHPTGLGTYFQPVSDDGFSGYDTGFIPTTWGPPNDDFAFHMRLTLD